MREQTKMLCASLPNLAQWFRDYDEQGHDWVIVRWQNISPQQVTLNDLKPLPVVNVNSMAQMNLFTSRTASLRRSEESCRHISNRSESQHMGVWTWQDGKIRQYQTVLPEKALSHQVTQEAAPPSEPQSFLEKLKSWLRKYISGKE